MSAALAAIPFLAGRSVDQIGIVVSDLEQALERYSRLVGGGPWTCYTYGPETIPRHGFRGGPGGFSVRIALGTQRPQLELLERLQGPSVYDELIEARGEGLHHVAFFVPSLDEAIGAMAEAGYDVLQWGAGYGLDGDGGFAYFDTERDLSLVVETVEIPRRRREPELVWP